MFQTFSGTSRRPRNVNLSGSSRSPFGSTQQTTHPGGLSGSSTILQAQQERLARQVERERLRAAKVLQRHWRGYSVRRKTVMDCRQRWDYGKARMEQETAYHTTIEPSDEHTELQRLRLLSWFAWSGNLSDEQRVCLFAEWLQTFVSENHVSHLSEDWRAPLVKLSRFALKSIYLRMSDSNGAEDRQSLLTLLGLVYQTATKFPDGLVKPRQLFYPHLRKVVVKNGAQSHDFQEILLNVIITPLLHASPADSNGYEGFVREILTIPELHTFIDLPKISVIAEREHLAKTTRRLLGSTAKDSMLATTSREDLAWTLANFIFLHRKTNFNLSSTSPNIDFVASVTVLLSHLDDVTGKRHDFHNTTNNPQIPSFIENEVAFLINKESIMRFIALSDFAIVSSQSTEGQSDGPAILASYALILLQSFPRQADDIRSWLYMSSTPVTANATEEPAIKYFWKVVACSSVYRDIHQSSNNAVALLKYEKANASSNSHHRQKLDQEWRVIFLFLELYTFVLKIMDDDEFMTGNAGDKSVSRTRRSALELSQVRELTVFLKNLAFSMYWNASEIIDAKEPVEPHSLANYFGNQSSEISFKTQVETVETQAHRSFAGVEGMTLAYMKGMVTGLLRMLYERDSRRHFCGAEHWLMKGLEMRGFIEAVVVEQAFRDAQEDEEDEVDDEMEVDLASDDESLIGTSRTKQIRRLEKLRLQQQRSSRRKLLKSHTPRLEILQNMPFFIPFATRVEIFRQFATADQLHRRNGQIDADQWRMSIANRISPNQIRMGLHELGRHSAKVRREHVFEDAFKQFYELGEGLKEPIQITFVDQFDTPEAGIDGGGVTKEFLTSITTEAFSTEGGQSLFVENDDHLLYPNPSAVDELREVLRDAGISEGSPEWNMHIRELLQHYEFLGRVMGKCLYEGILEDIHFAPFFLVKWALTGGAGAASNESGYRANINDLRDLDKELYENLLKLKNYPGNVEDFSLDFTITDAVRRDRNGAPVKSVTRNLRHGGASIPVTNDNRLIYISAVARHRLQTQPAAQTYAFLKGLATMIQPAWLSMFNQSELQTLLGGDASEIDVEDLRANTLYGGVYVIGDDGEEHPTVQQFWSVLAEMSDEDRRKVLKYVTSTPRGPLLGFGQLNPRFSIRDSGSEQSRLPSTSTCVNLLKLPIYKSKEVLRERLLYAVNAGAGFNLS